MKRPWFGEAQYHSLEITRTKAGVKKETHQIVIKEMSVIEGFIAKINKISTSGDMMKSFLIDETIFLKFKNDKTTTTIEIYDGRFKTPSTGFNTEEADQKLEESLYKEIKALLH